MFLLWYSCCVFLVSYCLMFLMMVSITSSQPYAFTEWMFSTISEVRARRRLIIPPRFTLFTGNSFTLSTCSSIIHAYTHTDCKTLGHRTSACLCMVVYTGTDILCVYNMSGCVVVFPYRWGPIFWESHAWMMPSRVRAASAQKPFTSISSQIRPTYKIHCRGVIHTKWARPKLWNKQKQ